MMPTLLKFWNSHHSTEVLDPTQYQKGRNQSQERQEHLKLQEQPKQLEKQKHQEHQDIRHTKLSIKSPQNRKLEGE